MICKLLRSSDVVKLLCKMLIEPPVRQMEDFCALERAGVWFLDHLKFSSPLNFADWPLRGL